MQQRADRPGCPSSFEITAHSMLQTVGTSPKVPTVRDWVTAAIVPAEVWKAAEDRVAAIGQPHANVKGVHSTAVVAPQKTHNPMDYVSQARVTVNRAHYKHKRLETAPEFDALIKSVQELGFVEFVAVCRTAGYYKVGR